MEYKVSRVADQPLALDVVYNFTQEEVKRAYNIELSKIAKDKKFKLAGYRSGKIPLEVVDRYRSREVWNAVFDVLRDEATRLFCAENEQRIIGLVKTEVSDSENSELKLTIRYEEAPEVDLGKLAEKEFKLPKVDVADAVDEMVLALRQQRAPFVPTEAPAELDNLVKYTAVAYDEDGNIYKLLTAKEPIQFVLGDYELPEELSAAFVGKTAGEKFTFNYIAKGEGSEFTTYKLDVDLLEVSKRQLPDVDEKFVELYLQGKGTLEDLKELIKKNVERELKVNFVNYCIPRLRVVCDETYADLELPEVMLAAETQRQLDGYLGQYITPEQFKALSDKEKEELLAKFDSEMFKEAAKTSLRFQFVYQSVLQKYDLAATKPELDEYCQSVSVMFENPAEFLHSIYKDSQQLQAYSNQITDYKVVNKLLELLKVTEVPTPYTVFVREARRFN